MLQSDHTQAGYNAALCAGKQQMNNPSGGSSRAAPARRVLLLIPAISLFPSGNALGGIPSHTSDTGAPIAGILARFYGNRSRGSVHCNQ